MQLCFSATVHNKLPAGHTLFKHHANYFWTNLMKQQLRLFAQSVQMDGFGRGRRGMCLSKMLRLVLRQGLLAKACLLECKLSYPYAVCGQTFCIAPPFLILLLLCFFLCGRRQCTHKSFVTACLLLLIQYSLIH